MKKALTDSTMTTAAPPTPADDAAATEAMRVLIVGLVRWAQAKRAAALAEETGR